MRLVPPAVRPHVIRFGQTGALAGLAILAMAAAPVGMIAASPEKVVEVSAPIAPPVKAVAYRINSPFGLRKLAIEAKARAHKGVDVAAPTGTGVFATTEGKVLRAGYQAGGYGNFIELQHPNGMTSLYAHLSRIDVHSGKTVTAGERIGLVGSTGYSTGPHLHFEVRRNGGQVDPAKIVGQSFDIRVKAPV